MGVVVNKAVLALSLCCASLVFSNDCECCWEEENCYTDCCCADPNPCECVVLEAECVDCTCYTPPYYNLREAWGLALDLEFLYFYSRERLPSYGRRLVDVDDGAGGIATVPNNFYYLDSKWDPGFRVGLGMDTCCDGWDIMATWTYYQNKESDSRSVEPPSASPQVGRQTLASQWTADFGPSDALAAKWRFRFNQIDLIMGKAFWVSPCFVLRPFAGPRGIWTRTRFEVLASGTVTDSGASTVDEHSVSAQYHNKFWGVGLLAGTGMNWYLSSCFSLYGKGDVSLLWGKYDIKREETFFSQETVSGGAPSIVTNFANTVYSDFHHMQPMVDVELGVSLESNWCNCRLRGTLQVGWEHHYLWEHNDRVPSDEDLSAFSSVAFGGGVIRARLDF